MYCKNCGHEAAQGVKFCKNCGRPIGNHSLPASHNPGWFKRYKTPLIVTGSVLGVLVVGYLVLPYTDTDSDSEPMDFLSLIEAVKEARNDEVTTSYVGKTFTTDDTRDAVAASVVDILCDDVEEFAGGSGTMVDPAGIILTNNHIIPQDEEGTPTVKTCLITLPDQTGKVDEIYWARPIAIPYVSAEYDLAFFEVTEPYVDDNGKLYGSFNKEFDAFWSYGCENNEPRLGEPIRVYGYPSISGGGFYLTVTDGVISAIPNDGTIVTSAKISHGNSGGLAVDADGCMIGVPSMSSGDEYESLGIIISNPVIHEFMDDFEAYLEISE